MHEDSEASLGGVTQCVSLGFSFDEVAGEGSFESWTVQTDDFFVDDAYGLRFADEEGDYSAERSRSWLVIIL